MLTKNKQREWEVREWGEGGGRVGETEGRMERKGETGTEREREGGRERGGDLSLIHISEPTRLA